MGRCAGCCTPAPRTDRGGTAEKAAHEDLHSEQGSLPGEHAGRFLRGAPPDRLDLHPRPHGPGQPGAVSQFTNVSFDPAMVVFSANQTVDGVRKDTVVNTEATGAFVWNMATWALRNAVNETAEALPAGVDEFERAGLHKQQAVRVNAPMVADSPVRFECEYMQTVRLPGGGAMGAVDVVFGRVIAVHIDDDALTPDGRIDVLRLRPIARMGYFDYTSVESAFEMVIPGDERLLAGLEGSAAGNRQLPREPSR
ncbi:flavin reductase family protein [Nocardia sp. NPDC050697]|uniref:flavin reductase family protein n=1 Tax=Nocardia sp. NPDC050697 TaxID=3155158 RepID=UPI0033E30C40